jgi:16S rRNA (adenine1518-N6/adenine1519-N6)-dimethyltransferase
VTLDGLPPLREGLAAQGLSADKGFGQHFLLDLNLTRKIARLAGPLEGHGVLEVGPGPGGLTRALLEEGAAHMVAVEKDARFLPMLREIADAAGGRLTVACEDALKWGQGARGAAAAPGLPVRVVANLPYNVATPLLIGWLTGPFRPASMTLMFQKEVAERIAAPCGADAYGRLSVLAQALTRAEVVLKVGARAFTPPPKVDSAVVRLERRADGPDDALTARLERVTAAAFGQRRKMLRSSLKTLGGEPLLEAAGVDPNARAETVPVEGFLRLAALLPLSLDGRGRGPSPKAMGG